MSGPRPIVLAIVGGRHHRRRLWRVALIVKADDLGVVLAANRSSSVLGAISRGIGRGLVYGMPRSS